MKQSAAILTMLATAAFARTEPQDVLRFTNGDQLHGTFAGLRPGPAVAWQRGDVAAAVDFTAAGLRHVVLHGGRPRQALATLAHAGLVGGDRIPGTLTALDGNVLTLESSCAGTLRIPRRQVPLLAPNPLGGRIHYHGPFSAEGWIMAHPSEPNSRPDTKPNPPPDATPGEQPVPWEFSNCAWYWPGKPGGTALLKDGAMPDRALLRFNLAWKNRLNLAVGFHADFTKPRDQEGGAAAARMRVPGDSADLPRLFGNSYVLQLYSGYLMLFRSSIDAAGRASMERVQVNNPGIRLGESGKATLEIRSNRASGAISLFINDEFAAQWSETDAFAGKGPGLGFAVLGEDSPVRISDVVVAEWNGMPDSARSMELNDQDVVLMVNGTDRFAGRATGLDDQKRIVFEARHGRLLLPLDEVAEIRFARDRLSAPDTPAKDAVTLRFHPLGTISGTPLDGDAESLRIRHPLLGELRVSTAAAVMLEFNQSNRIIDDWDDTF